MHIKAEEKINIYEYDVEVTMSRKVRLEAESEEEAIEKIHVEDYEIVAENMKESMWIFPSPIESLIIKAAIRK